MKKTRIAAGPGASSLILIAVVLSLCVLGALTMISARNDDALSIRSIDTAERDHQLFNQGEENLAMLDAILVRCRETGTDEAYLAAVEELLPEGFTMEDNQISWREQDGERILNCAIRVLPLSESRRFAWTLHTLITEDGEEDLEEDDWD